MQNDLLLPKGKTWVCAIFCGCHFQGLSFRLSTCFFLWHVSTMAGQAVTSEHCAVHRCLAWLRLASLLSADTTVSAVSAKIEKQDLDRFLNREKWGYSKIFDVIYKSRTTSKNGSMSSSGSAWRGEENEYTFVTVILSCQIAPRYSQSKICCTTGVAAVRLLFCHSLPCTSPLHDTSMSPGMWHKLKWQGCALPPEFLCTTQALLSV